MHEHRDDIGPQEASAASSDSERWRRWLPIGLIGAAVIALLAFLLGVVLGDNGEESVRTASPSTTLSPTTTAVSGQIQPGATSPLQPAPTSGPGVVNPVTGSTARLAAAPTTTTTAKAAPATAPCQNSHDPTCGPFKWQPDPGPNAALTASITCSEAICPPNKPVMGTAGQEMKFRIEADDPDSKIDHLCIVIDWGDESSNALGDCPQPRDCPTPYGPWAPPAKVPDHDRRDVVHTYKKAVNSTATVRYRSPASCDPNPYGGTASAAVNVTVSPAS